MSSDTDTQAPAVALRTVAQLRDQALSEPENFVKHMRHFRDVKNAPFVTSVDGLEEALQFVVFCQFASIPPQVNQQVNLEFYERFNASGNLFTMIEGQSKNLIVAAESQVGTHTAKIPNPSVESPSALFANSEVFEAAVSSHYVSTASVKSSQRIGAAGNAAQGKAQRLLATRLDIDGVLTDVAEDIAAGGKVCQALARIGFQDETLNGIAKIMNARMAGDVEQNTPGVGTKQLIWPTDEGDVVITPVHPYAMHVELARRLERRRETGSRIRTTFVTVGGSQPQNAGLVNGDMGGRHRLLIGIPPQVEGVESRTVYRDVVRGEIGYGKPSTDASISFLKLLKMTERDNRESRKALESAIRKMVVGIAMPFIRFRDASWQDGIDPNQIAFPRWAAPLIRDGYEGLTDKRKDLIEDVVDKVLEAVDPELLGARVDVDDFRAVVSKVVDEFFTDVFKGAKK